MKYLIPRQSWIAALTFSCVLFSYASLGDLSAEGAMDKFETYVERNSVADIRTVWQFFIDLISAPVNAQGREDGVYRGETTFDDYGYRHVIELVIRGGKIVSADYDETNSEGHAKQGDSLYCSRMMQGAGTSPAVAYPLYESSFIENQDLRDIHAITGATYSLYCFRTAVIRALMAGPIGK